LGGGAKKSRDIMGNVQKIELCCGDRFARGEESPRGIRFKKGGKFSGNPPCVSHIQGGGSEKGGKKNEKRRQKKQKKGKKSGDCLVG